MFKVNFDLAASARMEMARNGFDPDFPPGTDQQIVILRQKPAPAAVDDVRDLRSLLWSSIDNDISKDLDQIEVAERVANGIRVLVGIADVDADVTPESPIDGHAAKETVTVYTAVKNFPMLPEALSTDLTSLGRESGPAGDCDRNGGGLGRLDRFVEHLPCNRSQQGAVDLQCSRAVAGRAVGTRPESGRKRGVTSAVEIAG